MKLCAASFWLCLVAVSYVATAVETSVLRGASPSDSVTGTPSHRDLQLLSALCPIVSGLLPGDAICECAIVLGLEYVCSFGNPLCLGGQDGFCALPVVIGEISLAPLKVGFNFCASEATNNGQIVPGICINFGGVFQDEPDDADSRSENGALAKFLGGRKGRLSISEQPPISTPPIQYCDATVQDEACTSCELCNDGQGYLFDCTNVDARMIQSSCTPFSVITNLSKNQPKVSFLPQLDETE